MTDKRNRAALFRSRLALAMAASGQSQSALARAVGVDRSTFSALLAPGTRLPNAQGVAEAATALGVSSDWLLGLTDRPLPLDRALDQAMSLTDAPRALFDETIFGWHREAAGYKIRHVPATLPDILKTRAVVEWEYRDTLGGAAEAAIAGFESQLDHLRGARSDYEIALPLHELAAFTDGTGYWAGLSAAARAGQEVRPMTWAELQPLLQEFWRQARATLTVRSAPGRLKQWLGMLTRTYSRNSSRPSTRFWKKSLYWMSGWYSAMTLSRSRCFQLR